MKIKGVLLDANGTLFDPAMSAKPIFEEFGLDPGLVNV